jgi:predicted NUDIX family phosphoesterase
MEKVVVVPNPPQIGFIPSLDIPYSDMVLIDRSIAEQSTMYRQIIPYIVFTYKHYVMMYQRCNGGEKRLNNLWSIGIGGHMNSFYMDIEIARELREEVVIGSKILDKIFLGSLLLNDSPVNLVHWGLVWQYKLDKPYMCSADESVQHLVFSSHPESQELEPWSKEILCRLQR